ncbi:beta-1,6-N-acetylglucosaminyltransferase [Negadavirga shengliensis]|uniref:Peptide O-xylosyltransferase n=1 Tax=Negadavirga shengliensis TaxID=1389218 RepID=A0ABV9T2C8_9BACT
MITNYIILAHTNPSQVKRMIAALNDDKTTHFYVHVDLKTDIDPFITALESFQNLIFLPPEKRQVCNWGGMGIVNATLTAMQMIVKNKEKGYAIILSGQDFPIKSKSFINAFLNKNYGTEFISGFPLPTPKWTEGGMWRIERYKFELSSKKGDYVLLPSFFDRDFYAIPSLKKLAKFVLKGRVLDLIKIIPKRKFPNYLKPYGGDTWLGFTTETVSEILQYLTDHPDFLEYIEGCHLPDEIIFQTLVWEIFKDRQHLIKDSLTYAKWVEPNAPSPEIFTSKDLRFLSELPEGKLFARKFDASRDSDIMDELEKQVLSAHPVKSPTLK